MCFKIIIQFYKFRNVIFFGSIAKQVRIAYDACSCFFNIRPTMVSKHSKLVKRLT
jgi:hypothetical protein